MRRYTKEHEWVDLDGTTAVVGISDHAQQQLGDVVYVDLPEVGRDLAAEEPMAVVESVKAASDVYAPIAGKVIAVNAALVDSPALVNQSPEGDGWFVKLAVSDPAEVDALMDEAAYGEFVESLG